MKFKTSSKNLGQLMRSGETTPSHQNNSEDISTTNNADQDRQARIGEELAELDTDSFERILRNVATSKTDLLKNVPLGVDPALISIMGLIDDAKGHRKAPVKFDEVVDFIDDGADEIVVDKKLTPSVTSPIRGNPITDLDTNNFGGEEENYLLRSEHDPISRMEMGRHQRLTSPQPIQVVVNPQPVEKTVDDVDPEKIRKSQKNWICDEREQLQYLQEKGLREFGKYDQLLGPVSKGEFASFTHGLSPIVGCDLGVLNPVSNNNYAVFQTCTPNGRLLPAVPRKYFGPNENPTVLKMRPTPQRPMTIVLQTTAPSLLTTTLTQSYTSHFSPPISPPVEQHNIESASKKKRAKKNAKKAAAAAAAANAPEDVGQAERVEEEDQEEDEKENKEEEMTEEEKEARRLRNRKQREKKKAKKAEKEEATKAADVEKASEGVVAGGSGQAAAAVAAGVKALVLVNSTQEEKSSNNNNSGTLRREKKTKLEKNVNSQYTVGKNALSAQVSLSIISEILGVTIEYEGDGGETLERVLRDLGINDVSELIVNPSKKKLKAVEQYKNRLKNNSIKEKEAKKMDESTVAASITKRCSSGAGQQSEEDDDQSYVSAQENLGGSTSRLSTPPTEFVDARQSREEAVENVMLDPNNYRDDEDVDELAKQLQQEEDEFITVGKNKKKNKKQAETAASSTASSSSSPPNRRASLSTTTNSSGPAPSRGNNRPVAHPTTLGDFMESTKKDTHKNVKHKKTSLTGVVGVPKKQTSFDESSVKDFPSISDTIPSHSVETPISVSTAPPAFSYADAAKKPSGENTPAHEMSPTPATSTCSPPPAPQVKKTTPSEQPATTSSNSPSASSTSSSSSSSPPPPPPTASAQPSSVPSFASAVAGGVQLPASVSAADDFSFGYEEPAPTTDSKIPDEKRKRQKKSKTSPPPPSSSSSLQEPRGMNGVDLLKSLSMSAAATAQDGKQEEKLAEMPKNGPTAFVVELMVQWKNQWDEFMTGSKPVVYKPAKRQQ